MWGLTHLAELNLNPIRVYSRTVFLTLLIPVALIVVTVCTLLPLEIVVHKKTPSGSQCYLNLSHDVKNVYFKCLIYTIPAFAASSEGSAMIKNKPVCFLWS